MPREAPIADVHINKHCSHLLLYRQSNLFARRGIEISRATLANSVNRGIAALQPIVDRTLVDALARLRLLADETTVKVLVNQNWVHVGPWL